MQIMIESEKEKFINKVVAAVSGGVEVGFRHKYYWYTQLDYNKNISHPEYSVLREKVKKDIEQISLAMEIIKEFKELGVDEIKIVIDERMCSNCVHYKHGEDIFSGKCKIGARIGYIHTTSGKHCGDFKRKEDS